LAATLQKKFPSAKITTNPGRRGDFLVKADGKVVWDKHAMDGKFPTEAQVLAALPAK
jgi:predicted Rdx family selenoprotein